MSRDRAIDAHYADRFNPSDPVMDAARTISAEYSTVPVSTTTAGTLTLLARMARPATAIEVGTGTGVSTLALLRGMPSSGILTSIDIDADKQAVARDLIGVARIRAHRVRMIHGRGEDALARLAAGGYDLVFVDSEPLTYDRLVPLAIERLAPGGLLVVNHALLGGAVAKPANRAPRTQVVRTMLDRIVERTDVARLILPVDDGLLVLTRV
ncbi:MULTISPECIES: O-methyltransferase [Brevibacterium]|uniref:O-methyltransferase n=1 Tax=Brevibacterium pityocampae TaxID=506594 RepID=A0ABP8JIB5_9MICO|nr:MULTISPECIES: class I SAM-dependent methyltransferase [Actinomycetes]MCK1802722.1 class I SAM-dependent methyltransferase [Brevibacterium sp. R8603A2]MCX0276256.1 class I SAM-dependent methyltransferase [Nocardia zapadnayensis]QCP05424.1 methyltransferase [Brevibacterium sp. CS2]